MKVTLLMIVKNERDDLPGCVESARGVVDDIVIVDTGSTDRTVDVAKELGARVHSIDWQDDFAAARNAALEYVASGWVLSLDADERLAGEDRGPIRRLVEDERVDGYLLVQRHYLAGPGYVTWTPARGLYPSMERGYPGYADNFALRLFRRRPDIVYEGRVHENVVTTDPAARFVTVSTDVVIHHYGKVGSRADEKRETYLRLGRRKIEDRPDDAKAWFELGVQLHELGRFHECAAPFQKAFELERAYTKALYYIGNAGYKLGRFAEARTALEEFLQLEPDDADGLVNLAGIERREGNVAGALALFDRAIAARGDFFPAWFNKAALLLSEGDYQDALPCFIRSVDLSPGYTQALFGLWQARALMADFRGAAAEMLEWVKTNPELTQMVTGAAEKFLENRNYRLVDEALTPLATAMDSAGVYAALGAAQLALHKIGDAERNLEKAIALDPAVNTARVNLAQLNEVYRNDKKTASALYQEALRRQPEHDLCRRRLSKLRSP